MAETIPGPEHPARVRLLSRASDLAVTQAQLVAGALRARWPGLQVELITRTSLGDRSPGTVLSQSIDKGLFTADLSEALVAGQADLVVHSWKDLPVVGRPDTIIAGTLERADVRDVLLVKRDAVLARPATVEVLTSSPRRAWQLQSSLGRLLPWPVTAFRTRDVRGNVPTRLEKLLNGDAAALVVAKAALDRLLATGGSAADTVRRAVTASRWMVLPVREFPAAPAQGALAVEVARHRTDVIELVRAITHVPTSRACEAERAILASYGGGCHEAIGAIVLVRPYGDVTSVRGRPREGHEVIMWSLARTGTTPPITTLSTIWPGPNERIASARRPLTTALPSDANAWLIARAEALPASVVLPESHVVWAAGSTTWAKLAARGIWVNGCAEGLGDDERPGVDGLAGEPLTWHRLTHAGSETPAATATYEVQYDLPADLDTRTHFYWTSGSMFLAALRRYPALRSAWHASGPGRTARIIREALDRPDRASIWLDYDEWLNTICPQDR